MKKLVVVAVLLVVLGVLYVVRAPIAISILSSNPDSKNGWFLLNTAASSQQAQTFVTEMVLDSHTRWRKGESVDLRYEIRSPMNLLRAGDKAPSPELAKALVQISIAREDCVGFGGFRNSFFQYDDRLSRVPTETVTAAIADYFAYTATERPEMLNRNFLAIATELARRGVHNDPKVTTGFASYMLSQGVWSTDAAKTRAALQKLADAPARVAAYQAAFVAGAAHAKPKRDEQETLLFMLGELVKARTEVNDDLAAALLVACSRYSGKRKASIGMVANVGEACLDLALAVDGLSDKMTRVAAARGDAKQQGFAGLLASEVQRLQSRKPTQLLAVWTRAKPSRPGPALTKAQRRNGYMFGSYRPSRAMRRDADFLVAAGASIKPALLRAYGSKSRGTVWLAARTLAQTDPQGLSSEVMRRIGKFRRVAYMFTNARRYDHAAFYHDGMRIEEGLQALAAAGDDVKLLYPWIRALSIPEAGFTQRAANLLRSRMDARQFADAMFGYLAIRPRFSQSEIEVYEKALASYEQIGRQLERKLGELLTRWRKPQRVPWILKIIGLRTLGRTGSASALPLLARYEKDTKAFYWTLTEKGSDKVVKRTRHLFRDLAKNAASEIGKRQAKTVAQATTPSGGSR